MAVTYLSCVNQKLGLARTLLASLTQAGTDRLHQKALVDAVSFHLVCAYRHYLRELAQQYGVKSVAGIGSELQLETALAGVGKAAAEAKELAVLRQSPNSWLSQLQSYYESLWELPPEALAGEIDTNRIAVTDLERAPVVTPDAQVLTDWLAAFGALVERHRESSTEY